MIRFKGKLSRYLSILLLLLVPVALSESLLQSEEETKSSEESDFPIKVTCIEVTVGNEPDTFGENVYIVYNSKTKDAIIIDPGTRDNRIESFIKKNKLKVRKILNTHGHWDHCSANRYYADLYKVKIVVHEGDAPFFVDDQEKQKPKRFYSGKSRLKVKGFDIKVLCTPGHSPGSVCYLINGILFSGDTLFKGSIGRTWGETKEEKEKKAAQEVSNIKEKLLHLPEETRVYPGHGPSSTIGYEKKNNPFLKG